jgi:hypothetical protein
MYRTKLLVTLGSPSGTSIHIAQPERRGHQNLFLRAFRGSGVNNVYREYENAPPTGVTAELIQQDIELSSAVFVLLSETVESLPFTRDWILVLVWSGSRKAKPVWVFEPHSSFGRITITIPCFDHYVGFNDNDAWRSIFAVAHRSLQ